MQPSSMASWMTGWLASRLADVRETSASRWPARQGPGPRRWLTLGLPLAVLAVGGAVGLALWAKWGFLIAFDTIRAYCF